MARQQLRPDDGYDDEPAYVDDDHRAIAEFASGYLDEDERDEFIDHLMERRGYQRVQSWGPRADPEPPADPGPAQGSSRTRPPSSTGGGGRGGQRRQGYFKR